MNNVTLHKDGKQKRTDVHRLVETDFVPNPDPVNFTTVNHEDEDTYNNVYTNSEWCDCTYSNTYSDDSFDRTYRDTYVRFPFNESQE